MTVAVGDIIELRRPEGYVYGLVMLCPAAYPPAIAFLRTVSLEPLTDPAVAVLRGPTAAALMPLPHDDSEGFCIVAHVTEVPEVRFQLPVRDRTRRVLYRWEWDGQSIELGNDSASRDLPVRRILAPGDLVEFLGDAREGDAK